MDLVDLIIALDEEEERETTTSKGRCGYTEIRWWCDCYLEITMDGLEGNLTWKVLSYKFIPCKKHKYFQKYLKPHLN